MLSRARTVAQRHSERRCALKYGQMRGLSGNLGNDLDAGRARADDADALTGEIRAFLWPSSGQIGFPRETVEPFKFGHMRFRDQARGKDAKLRLENLSPTRMDSPDPSCFVKVGGLNASGELNVVTQVKTFSNMLGVSQQFWLGGIAL